MKLYLWKLEQDENNSWDTYDSCVVVSESEEKAKKIKPTASDWGDPFNPWASSPDKVKATLIGEATNFLKEGSVVCASFNAG